MDDFCGRVDPEWIDIADSARLPGAVVAALWTLMLSAIIMTQGSGNAFIYFQF